MEPTKYLTEDLPALIAAIEEGIKAGINESELDRFEDAMSEAGLTEAFGKVTVEADYDLALIGELSDALDY